MNPLRHYDCDHVSNLKVGECLHRISRPFWLTPESSDKTAAWGVNHQLVIASTGLDDKIYLLEVTVPTPLSAGTLPTAAFLKTSHLTFWEILLRIPDTTTYLMRLAIISSLVTNGFTAMQASS